MVENYDDMLSRFYLVPEHNGQTDGQTDGQNCYINIALQLYVMSLYRSYVATRRYRRFTVDDATQRKSYNIALYRSTSNQLRFSDNLYTTTVPCSAL